VFSISRNVNRCFGDNTSRCTDVIHSGAAEITVDDRMLTIDGETTESLGKAAIVGSADGDLTGWVDAYRRLRSTVVDRSG